MPIIWRARRCCGFAPAVKIIAVECTSVVGRKGRAASIVIDTAGTRGGANGGWVGISPSCSERVRKAAGSKMRLMNKKSISHVEDNPNQEGGGKAREALATTGTTRTANNAGDSYGNARASGSRVGIQVRWIGEIDSCRVGNWVR